MDDLHDELKNVRLAKHIQTLWPQPHRYCRINTCLHELPHPAQLVQREAADVDRKVEGPISLVFFNFTIDDVADPSQKQYKNGQS